MTNVFISSTTGSLDDYRRAAIDVCRRHEIVPVAMEHFAPATQPPLDVCRQKVESCQLLVLLLGDRYGARPSGSELSYTELEYDWAIEHEIEVLPFVAGKGFPWSEPPRDQASLDRHYRDTAAMHTFLRKVKAAHTTKRFGDLGDFRLDLYETLVPYRPKQRTASAIPSWHGRSGRRARTLPSPPELCAMPAYVGGAPFTGRRPDLRDLDQWARSADPVLVVEAIGGTGKSALTWEWATRHASSVMPLAGTFWWSFYDGSASMERFLRELLSYLTASEDQARIAREDLPSLVAHELRRRPYLVVLDGFERLLMAYHQYDPSKVTDDDVEADRRANKHSIIDSLGYDVVRSLVRALPSKILVSTRMVPDALEGPAGDLLPGAVRHRLPGLGDADVRELLGRLGVNGGGHAQPFFAGLGNHPLLIGIVAGLVKNYRPAPGDLGAWLADQRFRLADLDLSARRHHILKAAFNGLDPGTARLLSWLSALSGAVHWSVLESINPLAGPGVLPPRAGALLDAALRDLEIRGLLWWNRRTNTYDMHPIVRAFSFGQLENDERVSANERIRDHFRTLPAEETGVVSSVEDLQQTIGLFRALTGARQYGEAYALWNRRLVDPLLVKLGANASIVELLEPFEITNVVGMRADLSISSHLAGRHDRGIEVELSILRSVLHDQDHDEVKASLGRLATHYRAAGQLAKHVTAVRLLAASETKSEKPQSLRLRQAVLEAVTGRLEHARRDLLNIKIADEPANNPWFYSDLSYWRLVVERRLGMNITLRDVGKAEAQAESSGWRARLKIAALSFEVALELGEFEVALEAAGRLNRMRRIGGHESVPVESAAALAKMGRTTEATESLIECLARLSRLHPFDRPHYLCAVAFAALGRNDEAIEHARQAQRQAWADGPRFSYHWELRQSEKLLARLGGQAAPLAAADPAASEIPHLQTIKRVLKLRAFHL